LLVLFELCVQDFTAFNPWSPFFELTRISFSSLPQINFPTPPSYVPHLTHPSRIIDEDLHDVPPNSPGEILCKGPVVTRGYHNNPAATRAAFLDGWFRTGDIGEYRDGKVYIVDRQKDLIKYKALQVAPAELETVLLSHPLIADAAVIGVPGNDTELPRAYVVADRSRIDEVQIKAFVKARVAEYKQLRGGVVFVDAIPKNASGKILKKDLRLMAQREAQRDMRAKL
jgi:4-coumarate--CoA ligase